MFDLSILDNVGKATDFSSTGTLGGEPELASASKEVRRNLSKLEVQDWLPAAASVYNISPKIEDYVVVPVIIMPTDMPNRNSVAFSYEDLLAFNPREGRPAYKTWTGKPTFLEHANQDYTKAKGIIFDSYMAPIKGTKQTLAKVVCLCGFDMKADRQLAMDIKTKKRTNYSMGASINMYECSICGCTTNQGSRDTACGHVIRGSLNLFNTRFGLKPAYYLARGITGFETSSVARPAWCSANEDTLIMSVL